MGASVVNWLALTVTPCLGPHWASLALQDRAMGPAGICVRGLAGFKLQTAKCQQIRGCVSPILQEPNQLVRTLVTLYNRDLRAAA